MGAGKELLEVCLKAEQVPARLAEVWHSYCSVLIKVAVPSNYTISGGLEL